MIKDDDIFVIRKGVTCKRRGNRVLFINPDLSKAIECVVSKHSLEALKILSYSGGDVESICDKLGFELPSDRSSLRQLLSVLMEHRVIENQSWLRRIRPKDLSTDDFKRFSHQLQFFSSYEHSQTSRFDYLQRLFDSNALLIGVGGIGSIIFDLLIRAGVRRMTIIDHDSIELSNLTRQSLYTKNDLGQFKVDVAKRRAQQVDPQVSIKAIRKKIVRTHNLKLISSHTDLAIICADEPSIEDLCDIVAPIFHSKRIPYIIAGGYSAHMGSMPKTILPGISTCWRCYKNTIDSEHWDEWIVPPDVSHHASGMSAVAGILASFTALEALKVLSGFSTPSFLNCTGEIRFSDLRIFSKRVYRKSSCDFCKRRSR